MKCDLREINHRLRTPVAGILGIVKILERENLNTTQLEFVKDIEICGHSLLVSIETFTKKCAQKKASPSKLRILLVEDEPILQKATRYLLESKGHTVDVAENGKIALQKLSNDYDIIFMDIRMPEMDGFATARVIRTLEGKKHIPIVALTAEGNSIKKECVAAGMDNFMVKPFNMDELDTLLSNINQDNDIKHN